MPMQPSSKQYDDRVYVQLQKIACACVCTFCLFLTSSNTLLWCCPTGRTKLKKNDSLPYFVFHFTDCVFPVCAYPGWDFPGPGSWAGITPMIWSLNLWYKASWSGLVMKSPVMYPVGHHTNDKSPCVTLLVIKKYRIFMCLVRLLLKTFPFFSKRIELLMPWNRTLSKILYPRAFKK